VSISNLLFSGFSLRCQQMEPESSLAFPAVTASKFYDWRQRYGCVNEHNGWVPRDFWLEPWEKEAIIGFHLQSPLEGYRRLTFRMLDADVVAVSPASVWRVLKQAGLLSRWKRVLCPQDAASGWLLFLLE
jgi:hypothetical protein